jgi:hypothetical protein
MKKNPRRKRTKADRQAAMPKTVEGSAEAAVTTGLAERIEESLTAKTPSPITDPPPVAPAPPPTLERPTPKAGQVWSSNGGKAERKYIRIAEVRRLPQPDIGYVNAVRIAADGTRLRDTVLRGEYQKTMLTQAGEMEVVYQYESTITETVTLDMSTDSAEKAREKKAMSSNHTETVPTAKKVVPGIFPKKSKAAKPAKKAAPKKTNGEPHELKDELILSYARVLILRGQARYSKHEKGYSFIKRERDGSSAKAEDPNKTLEDAKFNSEPLKKKTSKKAN